MFPKIFSISLEDTTEVKLEYYAQTEEKNYYDNYLKNDFLFKNNFFEFKNRTFLGYSEDFKYIVNSFYAELTYGGFLTGYKNSYNDSNKLGSFEKYSYPKLKEMDNIFLIDTLRYRDLYTVQKNKFYMHEYIPVNMIYFSFDNFGINLNYETIQTDPKNIDPEETFRKLDYFEDYIASFSINYRGYRNGLMFLSGDNDTYYYKKVKDINRNGTAVDESGKDLLIYAFNKERFYFNLGAYNYEKLHFTTIKYIFSVNEIEYNIIFDANFLNNSISLFLTYDYDFKTYLHFTDSMEKDYFAAVSKNINIGRLETTAMAGYRDIYYVDKNYSGWYGSWLLTYRSNFADFFCSIGNYVYNNLWNSWFIYPEKNNFIFHFGIKKELKW
jgi:hypothetical protein